MANYWPNFWVDIRTAITTVWPEVGVNYRAIQMEKVNWENLLNSGGIVPPYVVIHVPPVQESEDWGVCNLTFTPTVSLYYIAQDASGLPAALEAKIKAMQDYLKSATFTAIQLLEGQSVDVTEANAVNVSMLEAAMPFSAGCLTFTCLVGESP